MSSPHMLQAPPPAAAPRPRNPLVPVLVTAGACLVAGSVAGVVIERVTEPRTEITAAAAQEVVEAVLRDDYGLADATSTDCPAPESTVGATFACTAKTSAVDSGRITVRVTVLNDAAQLSVGAPE